MTLNPSRSKWSEWLLLAPLIAFVLCLPQCHLDQSAGREEKYVTVHLNDSLKRFDSVDIAILVAADTSNVVGSMWSGKLPDPAAVPSYRLDDAEDRALAIRVRAYNASGQLILDMIISKVGGTQTVQNLPVYVPPVPPSLALAALQPSPGALVPAFDSAHKDYTIKLSYAESTLTLKAVPAFAEASVHAGALVLKSGQASEPIHLNVGDNPITVTIAAGKDSGAYTVMAMRAPAPPDTTHPPIPVEPYPAWKYKRIVDIKVNSLGMNKGTRVQGFPMLLRLTDGTLRFSQAGASGQDIRFATLDGKVLPYEITYWDAFNQKGSADIWVRLDTLKSDDDSARIYMYWGNPNATSESDGSKVFPSDDGFGSVLHLSEQAKGQAAEFKDATGKNHGTGGSGDGKNLPKRIDGVVGYGQDFHPASVVGGILGPLFSSLDQGTINLPSTFDPGNQIWTFQAWICRTTNADGTIFQKGEAMVAGKQRFKIRCNGANGGQVSIEREGAIYSTNVYLAANQFDHLGVVYNGNKADVYLNGLLKDSKIWSQGGEPLGRAVLGAFTANGDNAGYVGYMDEVWFASAIRSPEWMRLSYESQRQAGAPIAVLRAL